MDVDDELDEDDLLRRDIAHEVEEAFADVPYPGDDKLLRYSFSVDNDTVLESFRGKHWKEISPEELQLNEAHLSLFSPEAFCFFLPSFMVGALLHPEETNIVWQCVFYNLAPGHSDLDFLHERIKLLNARQKAAVRRYVELYVQTETSLPDPRKPEAVAFWQRMTEEASE